MRAARIENGVVADVWEVPSLTAFEGVTLIDAPDNVSRGWPYAGGIFTAPPRNLVDVVTGKVAELARAHGTALYADVTVAGKVYAADKDAQTTIRTLASRQGRGKPIPATIRDKNGVAVTLNPALLGLIEDAVFNQGAAASDNLAAKVALVKAATTVGQVDAVVW